MPDEPFKTRVTELLGIEYPIIQGGLQWLAKAELAAAVSNAGGLGIINSVSFDSKEDLRREIRKARNLTDKPLGVNISLFPPERPRPVKTEDYIDIVIDEGVEAVETAGRSPETYMEQFKKGNVKVIHKIPAVRFARSAERAGVDAVTLVGFEGGGHPGMDDVGTLVLIPLAADAVKIPVIAAGGIGDARGFLAALALGAEGVLMGTCFVASQECSAHPKVKEWLLKAQEIDTRIVQRSLRNPERVLQNKYSDKVQEMEQKGATMEELLPMLSGLRGKHLLETGDLDYGLFACGEVVGMIREIKSAEEIIDGIVKGAKDILKRLNPSKM